MRSYCRYLLLLVMLLPQTMMAQFNFDVETVEALIRDHKRIRSVLMVRVFDVLDLIANSTTTVMNAANTYTDVKKRLNDYKNLIDEYNEKLLLRGNIQMGDTLIISVGAKAMDQIAEDGKDIYASLTAIIAYGTGKVPCNTSNLISIILHIDESLDDIRKTINTAYMITWRYIQIRLTYYKGEVYRNRNVREIGADALSRWKKSSVDALNKGR